jgi:NAD-dependent dihydropyrimidine dehydrogenase PreA subunit
MNNHKEVFLLIRFGIQVVSPDRCIGCGNCTKVCQMEAITFSDTGITIRPDRCIGCGQCVSRCPNSVLKMKQVPGTQGPDRYCIDRIFL